MAKHYTGVQLEKDIVEKIDKDCKQEILKLHPELKGMAMSRSFIVRRVVEGWLKI